MNEPSANTTIVKEWWAKLKARIPFHPKIYQKVLLAGLGFIIFVILVNGVVMPVWVRKGSDTNVPNLMGMKLAIAEAALKARHLRIEVIGEKFEPNYPVGTVIFQAPEVDSRVKKDRVVKVTLSRGGEVSVIPKLLGLSLEQAEVRLSELGLKRGEVAYQASDSFPNGSVIASFPQMGSKVPSGMIVNLVVSQGSLIEAATVPNLLGRPLREGIRLVEKSGLKLGQVKIKTDPALLPETILSQSLEPGIKVPLGSEIDLLVSSLEE